MRPDFCLTRMALAALREWIGRGEGVGRLLQVMDDDELVRMVSVKVERTGWL